MARVKINFPETAPLFYNKIPVRITDINYGNHLGNDALLSIIHEARMQMLHFYGYTELDIDGIGLIMADVMIAYKNEAFYGDVLEISIYTDEVTERSFDLLYKINLLREGRAIDIAHAKTGMICFDYGNRKISAVNKALKQILKPVEN
ncbi:MAG TPA: thioesterase family protein [Flavipsychrobacter sp.]|nr:thioesterase family protein [Flavipsychrobacter sp.]